MTSFRHARAVALALPFFVTAALDYFYVGRRYFDLASDEAPHFWFGHALAWLTSPELQAIHTTHIPAIPFNQAGGYLLGYIRQSANPPETFALLGVVLTLSVAVAAALWGARIAERLSLSAPALFVMASLVAVQPSLTLFPHSAYYYLGLLSLPIGLGVALALQGRGAGTSTLGVTCMVIGVAMSLHFGALQVAAAFAVASAVAFLLPNRRSVIELCRSPRPSDVTQFFMIGAAAVFLAGWAWTYAPHGTTPAVQRYAVLAGAAAAVIALRVWRQLPVLPWLYVVTGWLVGCNVLWREWFGSFKLSYASKGGIQQPHHDLLAILWSAETQAFLFASPWRSLVFVLPVVAIGVCAFAAVRDRRAGLRFLPLAVFAAALSFLSVLSAAPAGQAPWGQLIKIDRFFIGATAIVPVVGVVLWELLPRVRMAAGIAGMTCAMVMYGHYVRSVQPTVTEARRLNDEITPLIERFRSEHPAGTVLCFAGQYVPEACSAAFSYTWHAYLIGQEAAKYVSNPTRTTPMMGCDSAVTCLGEPLPVSKPYLIIARPEHMPEALRSAGPALFEYKTPITDKGMGHNVRVTLLSPAPAGGQ